MDGNKFKTPIPVGKLPFFDLAGSECGRFLNNNVCMIFFFTFLQSVQATNFESTLRYQMFEI